MKIYTGNCYVGVVGGENQNGQCYDSITNMIRRPGDTITMSYATKGYEARQQHINKFLENKQFDFIFLMDADMQFPDTALERLRSHCLPYISGLYMRRRSQPPVAPVWYQPSTNDDFLNMQWWSAPIEANRLYEIGASGWGCMLIHREVFEKTAPLLKGEPFVIEDDMDIWPYDLARVMSVLKKDWLTQDDARQAQAILREEIRPMRVRKDTVVGSDVRFPFFAKQAGYQLVGDSSVACAHMLNYALKPTDYFEQLRAQPETSEFLKQETAAAWQGEQDSIIAARGAL